MLQVPLMNRATGFTLHMISSSHLLCSLPTFVLCSHTVFSAWVLLGCAASSCHGQAIGSGDAGSYTLKWVGLWLSSLPRQEGRPAPKNLPDVADEVFWSEGARNYTQLWVRLWISSPTWVKRRTLQVQQGLFVVLTQDDPLPVLPGQLVPPALLCKPSALPCIPSSMFECCWAMHLPGCC